MRIMDAEVAHGSRLVQVGYMRRYDPAYRAMKEVVDSGQIGAPLIMHCGHRNPSVPGYYKKESAIVDTAVHEIDLVRWLFGEEIVAVRVLTPRKSKNGGDLQDPMIIIFEMASGAIVDVEVSVNIRYGYDIRGEIVGEERHRLAGRLRAGHGARAAGPTAAWCPPTGGSGSSAPTTSRSRSGSTVSPPAQPALRAQLLGRLRGPGGRRRRSVAALASGERVEVTLADKPALYA